MEHLTKQQLILLALLVSFVTSIATGIMTVSLLNEASPTVLQSVNRVVERTIERVVPVEGQSQNQKAAVITKETIVVTSDDLRVKAVEKTVKSTASVIAISENDSEERIETTLGRGFAVFADEEVRFIAPTYAEDADEIFAVTDNGNRISLKQMNKSSTGEGSRPSISFYKIAADEENANTLSEVVLGDADALKLGQALVAIGGIDTAEVHDGIVTHFIEKKKTSDLENAPSETIREAIATDMAHKQTVGEIVVTLSGEVVGMHIGNDGEYMTISEILKTIAPEKKNDVTAKENP